MRRALLVVMVMLPAVVHAQATVTVNLSPQGQALATQLGTTPADLAAKIQSQVESAYDIGNLPGFIRSFADATTFAQRGLGVDYMSLPNSFVLGVGAQVALATDGDLNPSQSTTAGFAANVSVMLGVNLGKWDHPRWTLYANGFYENGSTDRLNGSIITAGGHVQYRLVDPQRDKGVEAAILRWAGIDITTGVEYTRWVFGANDTITNDYTVAAGTGSTDLTVSSTGQFDLKSNALTIPIELTTGFRILEVVSIYGGIGFDFTEGKADLDANLNGTMKTSDGTSVGTVTIVGGGNNTASPGNFYGLAGVQLNIWALKIFSQVNASPEPAASIAFGIRLVL
ncbi:MAG TPA: hypothetical protein VGG74_18510 [Kofleriaceae bacterium]|jgi:hypothetical protein